MSDQRAGLTEDEIADAIREPMTIHLLSAADIVWTIATLRAELATILAERDAAVSMGTQLERELAARTEELTKARKAVVRVRHAGDWHTVERIIDAYLDEAPEEVITGNAVTIGVSNILRELANAAKMPGLTTADPNGPTFTAILGQTRCRVTVEVE